nr:hypothetical protein [Mesorhizobium sp. LNHC220B00]
MIASNSSFAYKGKAVAVKQIANELGVRYVIEGSVRKPLNRVRITAQLIDSETGAHLWGERYDRPIEDVFAVQDEITDTIIATIEPEISASERERARRKRPEHLGAWEFYQRGMWHLYRRNREDLIAAQSLFQRSSELDPEFASPHAALAVSFFFFITHGITSDLTATVNELFSEASLAVLLDPRDALGHSALGLAFMERREFDKSIVEHRTATSLNPNSSFAKFAFGYALITTLRLDEALEQFDAALRLSPRDPSRWSYLTLKSATLYYLTRYEEAVACARDATRYSVVDLIWPYVHLAAGLGQLGREEALVALRELRHRRPGLTISGYRNWPHNRNNAGSDLEHTIDGLRKAGLPE